MTNTILKVQEELTNVFAGAIAQLPALIAGVIAFVVFVFISKKIKRKVSAAVANKTGDLTTAATFERITSAIVLIVGFLLAAGIAFPNLSFDSLIATLGLTSIAVGFAFKDVFENFIAGLMILLSRPFSIGDTLRSQGITGKVEHIGVRSISLRQADGELVLIPAVKLVSDVVAVVTNQRARRFELIIGISANCDIDEAVQIMQEGLEAVEGVAQEPPPVVAADKFNSTSVDIKVHYWVDTKENTISGTRTRVVNQLKKILEANNISMSSSGPINPPVITSNPKSI